jgi:hypothetical protein
MIGSMREDIKISCVWLINFLYVAFAFEKKRNWMRKRKKRTK